MYVQKKIWIALGILFLLLPNILRSQDKHVGSPYVFNYSPADYSEDPQNWCIVQDKRDMVYIANTNGIMEYDGFEWRTIKLRNASLVWSFSVDSVGAIYAGAIGDFGKLYVGDQGQIEYKSLTFLRKDKTTKVGDIRHVLTTSHGVYFIDKYRVYCFHKNTIQEIDLGLRNYSAHKVGDAIYLLTTKGIYYISDKIQRFLPQTEKLANDQKKLQILNWNDSTVLFVNESGEFNTYNREKALNATDSVPLWKNVVTEVSGYIAANGLNHAVELEGGNYALGTNGGVVFTNKNGELVALLNKNRGLANDFVRYLYVDRAGTLWLALEGGIAKVKPEAPISKLDKMNGLEGTSFTYINMNGRRYIGSMSGLQYLPDYHLQMQNDKFEMQPVKEVKAPVWSLTKKDDFLFATASDGLYSILNNVVKYYPTHKTYNLGTTPKLPNKVFMAQYSGLSVFDYGKMKSGTMTTRDIQNFEGIKTLCWNISTDIKGDLWVSSYFSGVYYIRISDDQDIDVQLYTKEHGIPQPYNNLHVECVDDSVFLTTPEGIYASALPGAGAEAYFQPVIGLQYVSKDERLIDVKKLSHRGNKIWAISKRHAGYFDTTKETPQWVEVPFVNKPSYIHNVVFSDSAAWFCSNNGLYQYRYFVEQKSYVGFNALIRRVRYNADSLVFKGAHTSSLDTLKSAAQLKQASHEIPVFKGNTSLIFDYTSTSYNKEKSIRFRYKLEGFNNKWSNWSSRRTKEYTNLSAGRYHFRVEAKDVFGTISKASDYQFVIEPPFYEHPLSILVYFVSFLALVYGVVRYNIQRLKDANKRLESIVSERTREVEEQKDELEKQAQNLELTNKELEKLSIVASNTDNAVFIMDAEANFEWMNDGFTRLYGYNLEEYIEIFGENLVRTSSAQDIKLAVDNCIKNKTSVSYQARTRNKENELIWAQTTLTPVLNDKGEVKKLVAIDSNISKLKEAEFEILQKSEELKQTTEQLAETNTELEKLSVVARETDNAVIIMDALGYFEWVNESFTKMFGYTLDQLIERKGGNIKNTKKQFVVDIIDSCIETRKSVQYEFVTHMRTGEEIWVHATVTPITNDEGEIIKLIAVDSNITIQKQAEQELKRQSQVIREQSERVERQNESITSSIRYAETIQRANLPIAENTERYFKSFTIFKPKDIVSGDFYWYSRKYYKRHSLIFCAVVDCVGHGVPGAFMSMIGSRLLSEIVNDREILEPRDILEALHVGVQTALKQEKTDNNDGMDVCLCCINTASKDSTIVTFSGAKRPLFVVRQGQSEVLQLKGSRRTIGGVRSKVETSFEQGVVLLPKGSMIYLTTDGIIDQNAPSRKRYGTPKLLELIHKVNKLGLEEQKDEIEASLARHQENEEQRDDITMMGIRL